MAQITGVHVRETVPDSILDRADAIELVDITPDDLIQRLKEGKVYVPKQAERALEHFFSPANLTALRELALRRTAERVDEQLLDEMQARAISGPWAAGERLLVCVSEDPRAAGLVRYTKRLADRLHGPLDGALHRDQAQPATDRGGARPHRRYASAGASFGRGAGHHSRRRPPHRRRRGRLCASQQHHPDRHRQIDAVTSWFELLHGSVVRDLLRCCGNISVHVIAGENLDKESIPRKTVRTAEKTAPFDPRPYLSAVLAVRRRHWHRQVILWPWIGTENIDLVYLTAVVGMPCGYGLWPSLLAGIVSARFATISSSLPPVLHIYHRRPTNVVAVLFFAIMAIVVSNVAARARTLAVTAMARARTTESLYAFSRKLSGAGTLDDVLGPRLSNGADAEGPGRPIAARRMEPSPSRPAIRPRTMLDEADLAAAKWAWEHDRAAGRGSDTLPGAKRLFLPMRTGRGAIGVVGIDSDKPGPLLTPDQRRLLDALIDQAASGHRTRPSRGRSGSGQTQGRGRSLALRAAHVHFP